MALITPTDSVCTSTHAQFKSADSFAANFVIDRPVVDVIDFTKYALRAAALFCCFDLVIINRITVGAHSVRPHPTEMTMLKG